MSSLLEHNGFSIFQHTAVSGSQRITEGNLLAKHWLFIHLLKSN